MEVVTIAIANSNYQEVISTGNVLQQLIQASRDGYVSVPAILAIQENDTIIRYVSVEYTFAQLDAWREELLPLFSTELVTMIDADERANRVSIGTRNLSDSEVIIDYATQRGIPIEALNIIEFRLFN